MLLPPFSPSSRFATRLAGVATAGFLGLGALTCARQHPPIAGSTGGGSAVRPATTGDRATYSVYDLGARWSDAHGAMRTLASLRGRPVALAMIYTHCTASCPLTLVEMKRIEAATDHRVGLVLVSLDPARDSSAQLDQYAQDRDLSPERWTLLRGSDDAVRDLAAALGVRYRRLSNDDIAHSNLVTLLDAGGSVVAQEAGLRGADDLIVTARSLLR
jgi:protein SCO1/2